MQKFKIYCFSRIHDFLSMGGVGIRCINFFTGRGSKFEFFRVGGLTPPPSQTIGFLYLRMYLKNETMNRFIYNFFL